VRFQVGFSTYFGSIANWFELAGALAKQSPTKKGQGPEWDGAAQGQRSQRNA